MTIEECKELVANEQKKLEALTKIVAILEKLEEDTDSDARDWVIEKINE